MLLVREFSTIYIPNIYFCYQRKVSLDIKYQAVKAYARAGELEKQVSNC